MFNLRRKRNKLKNQTVTEKPQNIKHALKLFIKLLMQRKKSIFTVITMAILGSVMYTAIPWFMGIAIDNVAKLITDFGIGNFSFEQVIHVITWPLIGLLIASILSFIFSFIQERIMAVVSEDSGTYLRQLMTDKMDRLPLKFYDDIKVGEILSRNSVDIERIAEILVVGFNQFLSSVFNIIIGLVVMIYISPILTLIVFVLILISSYTTMFISKKSQKAFAENFETLGEFNSLVEEMVTGNTLVKVFNQQDESIERVKESNRKQHDAHLKAMFMNYAIYPAVRFLNQIAFIVSAVVGAVFAIQRKMSVGVVQAYLQYVSQVSEPITEASFIINSFQASLASIERVYQIIDMKDEVSDIENPIVIKKTKGQVEFKNVKFGYNQDEMIMNGVSFIAKPKQMIAIVGPTGAGKTTLINLLMRFYEINEGQILIDGVDTKNMARRDVRQMFGMVLQDTWLFEGSVKDNLSYGKKDATLEEIKTAATLAQSHHFIEMMPYGYDTIISSDASIVSQGQQQLLTIARTAVANPPILILDEATSNIDTITEKKIQEALAELMKDRTSFVIAHRLSTIRNADLILVMNKGNIVESGNHDELITKNGMYAELYNSQFMNN
ncbi:ABC transporter, ATP-binding protein and permease [Alteracholeplasma palmae J233]|uniref:ABC transporter, ATP-binding protein and permease n=1 Tax=Alteracholeplasma palmae (strain ATCC 49389 / J233) TaxID=1318466 RepID=U4KPZ8_ALTPJ|nr:ABC transporter ATP-binding protein [Alteracholeplasma palmae]CCV64375.1 ABC transporter, ATP-binding protein and permease [Alteracholeplasma palmae J233]